MSTPAIDGSWYERPEGSPVHHAAGGVVGRLHDGRVMIAFALERDHPGPVLPKGHVKRRESWEQAARREITEEVGLSDLYLLDDLGVAERLNFDRTGWKITHYYLYGTHQLAGKIADPFHHHTTLWFPLDDLPELFWPEQSALLARSRDTIDAAVREWAARSPSHRDAAASS